MADQPRLRLVLFRLGTLTCAAPATLVREVIPAGRPTRIPGTGGSVAGLLNLRGILLTVVDGRRVVTGDGQESEPESVLVLDRGERTFGLAVDEVLDLVELGEEDLAGSETLPGIDPQLVRAVGRHGTRVFAVLDTEALAVPLLG